MDSVTILGNLFFIAEQNYKRVLEADEHALRLQVISEAQEALLKLQSLAITEDYRWLRQLTARKLLHLHNLSCTKPRETSKVSASRDPQKTNDACILEELKQMPSLKGLMSQPVPQYKINLPPLVLTEHQPDNRPLECPELKNPASTWAAKIPRREGQNDVHQSRQDSRKQREDEDDTELKSAFQTAKNKLYADCRKRGQAPPQLSNSSAIARANIAGLRRNNAGNRFVPPFIKKALAAQQGGGGGNTINMENDGGEALPFSMRTMELLRLNVEEPLPEELAKLDAALVESICNEVIADGGGITWDDIAGQDAAKSLIAEVVVWPMLNPDIFTGARAPPKGVLLFGPPGTGKTLLGKAIASNIKAAFFAISASSLTSKWIGEGEKLVRTLFAVAAWISPSVIFIDEIDSLLSARKSDGEHEASRRMKTELLVQMEGCDPTNAERRVLLIGATNRPEELDEAARRRMPKQLYIPLPCETARKQMIVRALRPGGKIAVSLTEKELEKIVEKTHGYSGSDMRNLIQEACQGPVRDAVKHHGAGVANLTEHDLRAVVLKDFVFAAKIQKASVQPEEVVRYEVYNERHGARMTEEDIDDDEW